MLLLKERLVCGRAANLPSPNSKSHKKRVISICPLAESNLVNINLTIVVRFLKNTLPDMKLTIHLIFAALLLSMASSCAKDVAPPEPFGALPSAQQLAWHELEYYMFVHFNMNTFTNQEWGFGDESPETFAPTALSCDQWARIAKTAGMKGIIITAKHHDGFCLWPSKYTEHSVKNSPWKEGKGDVVRELADACKKQGLKFGVYLSPWDRNHAGYGKPQYITFFRNQLTELLTQYGEVFEVWFDGANGGTGYYGGANERRSVDRQSYYDWESTVQLVRNLMPEALIFSDAGPDIRWVGNEDGMGSPTNWAMLNRENLYPGCPCADFLGQGHHDGNSWVPAEVDVSIRPGWYYHPAEDSTVKSVEHLLDIYYASIGRNCNLLLNIPIDTRGLIHENDSARLMQFKQATDKEFANAIESFSEITASDTRGNSPKYSPDKLTDNDQQTYWATNDSVTSAHFTVSFDKPKTFNRVVLQEFIALGQRVEKFSVEIFSNKKWQTIAKETTIGYKRILRLPPQKAEKIRIDIKKSKACPLISNFEIYNAP